MSAAHRCASQDGGGSNAAALSVSALSSLLQQLSAPAPLEMAALDTQLKERTQRTQQLFVRTHVMAASGPSPPEPRSFGAS